MPRKSNENHLRVRTLVAGIFLLSVVGTRKLAPGLFEGIRKRKEDEAEDDIHK